MLDCTELLPGRDGPFRTFIAMASRSAQPAAMPQAAPQQHRQRPTLHKPRNKHKSAAPAPLQDTAKLQVLTCTFGGCGRARCCSCANPISGAYCSCMTGSAGTGGLQQLPRAGARLIVQADRCHHMAAGHLPGPVRQSRCESLIAEAVQSKLGTRDLQILSRPLPKAGWRSTGSTLLWLQVLEYFEGLAIRSARTEHAIPAVSAYQCLSSNSDAEKWPPRACASSYKQPL